MILRLIPALALALLGASSNAETRYDFSYTGLYFDQSWDDTTGEFSPGAAITGFFAVEDYNSDGAFQVDELTDFAFSYNSNVWAGGLIHVIGPEVPDYCLRCEVNTFAYTPGGTLLFEATLSGVRFDQRLSNNSLWTAFYGDHWTLTVTPDTVINVAEVPEPGTGFMFLAGLVGLACVVKLKAARS